MQPKQADISAKGAEQQQQTNETIKPKQHNQANKKGGGQRTRATEQRAKAGQEQTHKNNTSTKRKQTKKHQGTQRGVDTQKKHPRKGQTGS